MKCLSNLFWRYAFCREIICIRTHSKTAIYSHVKELMAHYKDSSNSSKFISLYLTIHWNKLKHTSLNYYFASVWRKYLWFILYKCHIAKYHCTPFFYRRIRDFLFSMNFNGNKTFVHQYVCCAAMSYSDSLCLSPGDYIIFHFLWYSCNPYICLLTCKFRGMSCLYL